MDRDEVEVHKLAKKKTRPISSHLDRTNLVNKGFIIWLLVKFCLRDTAGSPERARWLHLARSGSQSQRAIWFILPAHGASHIIKPVIILSKYFPVSDWLNHTHNSPYPAAVHQIWKESSPYRINDVKSAARCKLLNRWRQNDVKSAARCRLLNR